jgi:hypothetical protein
MPSRSRDDEQPLPARFRGMVDEAPGGVLPDG